jgi:hypothetical protein
MKMATSIPAQGQIRMVRLSEAWRGCLIAAGKKGAFQNSTGMLNYIFGGSTGFPADRRSMLQPR